MSASIDLDKQIRSCIGHDSLCATVRVGYARCQELRAVSESVLNIRQWPLRAVVAQRDCFVVVAQKRDA
jgi:hypothetical protein